VSNTPISPRGCIIYLIAIMLLVLFVIVAFGLLPVHK
jgi:hypothetical protein